MFFLVSRILNNCHKQDFDSTITSNEDVKTLGNVPYNSAAGIGEMEILQNRADASHLEVQLSKWETVDREMDYVDMSNVSLI